MYLEDQRRIPRITDALRDNATRSVQLNRALWMIEDGVSLIGGHEQNGSHNVFDEFHCSCAFQLSERLKVGELKPVPIVMM